MTAAVFFGLHGVLMATTHIHIHRPRAQAELLAARYGSAPDGWEAIRVVLPDLAALPAGIQRVNDG